MFFSRPMSACLFQRNKIFWLAFALVGLFWLPAGIRGSNAAEVSRQKRVSEEQNASFGAFLEPGSRPVAWADQARREGNKAHAPSSPLPEGLGLAAKYPGDRNIHRDPAVLFAEDFEAASLAEVLQHWTEAKNPQQEGIRLVEDAPPGSAGRQAVEMIAHPDRDTGAHLYKLLPRGVDRCFARFYVRFPKPAGYIHHFVHLGGYQPPTRWPQGGAGQRPQGNERITVGIEPWGDGGRNPPPGCWNFYVYWHQMRRSADGRYWGNGLHPVQPAQVPEGQWQCVEVMLKLNQVGKPDGELALWLDGKLIAHIRQGVRRSPWTGMGFRLLAEGGEPFEGFDFRTSDELKVNFFWLLHYVTPEALRRNGVQDLGQPVRVRFDHIVVATEYIGPLSSRPAGKD